MIVDLDAEALEALAEELSAFLPVVVGDDNRAYVQAAVGKLLAQAQQVLVVGDAQVRAHLVLLDVVGRYHHYNLSVVLELEEHVELAVGLKSREHARSVVIVKEFAAEFQVKLP